MMEINKELTSEMHQALTFLDSIYKTTGQSYPPNDGKERFITDGNQTNSIEGWGKQSNEYPKEE